MSQMLFVKLAMSLLIFIFVTILVSFKIKEEIGRKDKEGRKYSPIFPTVTLPTCILISAILLWCADGTGFAAPMILSIFLNVFIFIGLYDMLLLIVLPFLRKAVNARVCALLWIIPNFLYAVLTRAPYSNDSLLVLTIPESFIRLILFIWLAVFFVLFAWRILNHVRFRHEVMKNAVFVEDEQVLEILRCEEERVGISNPKFSLVISPSVATPLSVGLFSRAVILALPDRNYTAEELSLIFRHELIHIAREDAWTKFFMIFCASMCWFNPFVWAAVRKSAEDLELSCDEAVLVDEDESVRRRYAELILNTAKEGRGFTTCLSTSAASLRYRMKNIMKRKPFRSGSVVVGLAILLIFIYDNHIAVTYAQSSGLQMIYESKDASQIKLRYISDPTDPYNTLYKCTDQEAFYRFMAELRMEPLNGNYVIPDQEEQLTLIYESEEGTMGVILTRKMIKITKLYGEKPRQSYYYLPDGIDWDELEGLIEAYPALNVRFTPTQIDPYSGRTISASLFKLGKTESGELCFEADEKESVNGIIGYDEAKAAVLDFSMPLCFDPQVKVESWDYEEEAYIEVNRSDDLYVFDLAPYSAHYTVCVSVVGNHGVVYEAQFRFDCGSSD